MTRRNGSLKPCPFCGGRAVVIVEPVVLVRCIWIECSSCHTTSPMIDYTRIGDAEPDEQLRRARRMVTEFWNTRAEDGSAEGGADDA